MKLLFSPIWQITGFLVVERLHNFHPHSHPQKRRKKVKETYTAPEQNVSGIYRRLLYRESVLVD